MADDILLNSGSGGATIAADDISSVHYQRVKINYGVDGSATDVSDTNPLPIDDAGGSLTVDNAQLSVVGTGTEAAAMRVTIATDSTGLLSVDDNGGSLTVDNAGTFATQATLQAGTAEVGKLAAGVAEIGNVKNSGTFAVQAATTNAGTFAVQEDGAALTALQLIDDPVFADNSAFTPATSKVMVSGGVYQSGTPGILADNDAGALLLNSTSALMVELLAGSAEIGTVGLAAGTAEIGKLAAGVAEIGNVKNSGTFATQATCTNAGTFATQATLQAGTAEIGKLAAGTAEIGNVTNSGTFAVQSTLGAETTKVIGTVNVAAGQTIATTNAGTFATQATLQAGTAEIGKLAAGSAVIGEVTIGAATGATGDLAKTQDVAMGANDVGVAMLAVRDDEQAAMTPADGDYTTLRTDKFGNLKVTNLPDATSVVKFGVINHAVSGDNTLQAAAGAGIKIRVLSVMMVSAGTVTTRFESGAGGTALTGQMNLVANSGFSLPYNPAGWFETADNALLNLELSGAISVDGCFSYVEV